MDGLFKRVLAYFIDMLLVSFLVSTIVSSKVVNFQLTNYQALYSEYKEIYNLYNEQNNSDIKTCDDLTKSIDNKKITEEEYVSRYEEISQNKESLDEEYQSLCEVIVNDYNEHKMSKDDYIEKSNYFYYHLERNSTVSYVVNLCVCLLYFVLFQGFTGGQTLGKKIMRLKIVSLEDGEVSYKQLFIRTIFLYSIIYIFLTAISSYVIPIHLFTQVSNVLYILNNILSLILIFTISSNSKRRGLHDRVAHTRVKMMDFKGNEIKERFFWEKKEKIKNKISKSRKK